MRAVLKETESKWRELIVSVTGKLLGELRNIVKYVSQDDVFVAWGCAVFILYVIYRLLGGCLKLRQKCLQFLLFITGAYTVLYASWHGFNFLIVYIECMWTGPGVQDNWDEFNRNVLSKWSPLTRKHLRTVLMDQSLALWSVSFVILLIILPLFRTVTNKW